MSQWTHIAGTFRIDGIQFLKGIPPGEEGPIILEHFGKTCSWEDPEEIWDKCTVPKGTEGSLQFSYLSYGRNNALSIGSVVIWGDLRSYNDSEEIIAWFNKVVASFKSSPDTFSIRDAVLKIDIEGQNGYLCFFDGGYEVKTIEIKKKEEV